MTVPVPAALHVVFYGTLCVPPEASCICHWLPHLLIHRNRTGTSPAPLVTQRHSANVRRGPLHEAHEPRFSFYRGEFYVEGNWTSHCPGVVVARAEYDYRALSPLHIRRALPSATTRTLSLPFIIGRPF